MSSEKLHTYRVKLWYTTHITLDVKAKDSESAIEAAVHEGVPPHMVPEALKHMEVMDFNNEVEMVEE